jgi:uncharacterized membrane protein YkvA (DUF1232 family)
MRTILVALAVAVAVWLVVFVVLIALGRRERARDLARLVPNLLLLFRGLLRDPRVPRSSKLWLGFAVVWLASPIDVIPEFIPIVGPLDDAIVASIILRHVVRRTDRAIVADHWRGDPAMLDRLSARISER